MPMGAKAEAYSLGPNLKAAYDAIEMQRRDMSESTQDPVMSGQVEKGVTAFATAKAEQNARIFLGVFGILTAEMITQIGGLVMDCVVQYATVGEVDTTVPEALASKFKTFLAKGKEKGKEITNKIIFTDKYMGRKLTKKQIEGIEWKLFHKTGGLDSDQREYLINPYQFARTTYSMYVDPDKIIRKSMGLDRTEKMLAFNIMTDQRVAPYTDQKAVVDDFAIEEYGGDDPDKYKKKGPDASSMLGAMLGQANGPAAPGMAKPGGSVPTNNMLASPQPAAPALM